MTDIEVEIEERVRERTARLEATNRELAAFVAAVVRDLRSPLRAIQALAQLVTEKHAVELSGQATECIDCIRLNTEQMSRMLDGLTRISEAGGLGVARD